ncbi:YicC/YloC family endoribonuclease [Accumulibacter sp.]|uniref:YicC/YloC family endoribonuclease n=1 Tax=Accumulibacter sp. TaxID=2053492 RepID=UPI0025E50EF3|nr:YicC/YloC family endoribonuclease [Accumulibacter sp.]MCM8596486.1 YicC family protein [Accumulibacter sp.]MCM8627342.1 YicC family protein [Accumulibacter sp.]MDS4050634.1 YicC/YloC family endoribonuclease [Accumulibacter sp.]
MIFSMTGYAARTRNVRGGAVHVEFRGVNSRYLDCYFRIADELRLAEPALRELIAGRLCRGKIECRVSFVPASGDEHPVTLNAGLLERLKVFEGQVRSVLPQAAPLAVVDVLRWPGIFGEEAIDIGTVVPACLAVAGEALADFVASRAREGEKLAAVILDRVARMRVLAREVAPLIPSAQAAFNEKLRERLLEAVQAVDDERIRQEVAVFAARIDVAEELARLSAHLDEVERVIGAGGSCGKRLDFLMQELNREANTLGAKSLVSEVSQAAIEFKLLIEQMREQVQNLE